MSVQAAFETNYNYGAPAYGPIYAGPAAVASSPSGMNLLLLAGAALALFLFLRKN